MASSLKKGTWKNILEAMAQPSKQGVILRKITRRFFDKKGSLSEAAYRHWLEHNALEEKDFLGKFPAALEEETEEFARDLYAHADGILSKIPHALGGAGMVRLLYLVTRIAKPRTIVETGVATGYSSASFLNAMKQNGQGSLYSSDFPYFRLENPEQYVGIVVKPELRPSWTLLLKGDDANLPMILKQCGPIDLFHYDSDKSYTGRQKTVDLVWPSLSTNAIFIMDDIQDNCFFHDFAKTHPEKSCMIVHRKGKYVGLLNLPAIDSPRQPDI